jgi:ubiquinone/menaquinone biosynthesis C-methylase UbiE
MDRVRSFGELAVAWGGNAKALRWDFVLRWKAIKSLLPKIEPPISALEVGTGVGHYAIKLASIGAKVVAVDFCRPLLERGRSRSEALGLDVVWLEAEAENLPIRSEFCDLVLSVTCIQHLTALDRQKAAIKEILRVLRPGGIFILVEDTVTFGGGCVHRGYLLKHSKAAWIQLVESEGGILEKYLGVSFLRFRKWLPFWTSAYLDTVIRMTGLFNQFACVTAFKFRARGAKTRV